MPGHRACGSQKEHDARHSYGCSLVESGMSPGARPGDPPVGPLGLDPEGTSFGLPETDGISGLAAFIRSEVQYSAVPPAPSGAVFVVTS
jgi:hypothetical protein